MENETRILCGAMQGYMGAILYYRQGDKGLMGLYKVYIISALSLF